MNRPLTGHERILPQEDLIVSKTDLQGRIIYANENFSKLAGFREDEFLGRPHSIVRHPAMPKAVFKVLWDTLRSGKEIFALVINRSKNGDHYWVLAHVTPSFDRLGNIIGYHSTRRAPDRSAIEAVEPLYRQMVEAEQRAGGQDAIPAGLTVLTSALTQLGMSYDAFLFSLV